MILSKASDFRTRDISKNIIVIKIPNFSPSIQPFFTEFFPIINPPIKIDINDNMILNGIIANYLYYNGFYDVSYDRDICKSCYKGYKSDDEVVFFKGSLVDDICMKLVGRVIKWNIYSNAGI